jgi:cell volume regulation protein A
MTTAIIITLCTLLLVSYVFALTSAKTKIPSVLLLLILGWGIKQATVFFELQIPSLDPILPVLATIGLVLIVLEGSLELKLDRTKLGLVTKSCFWCPLPYSHHLICPCLCLSLFWRIRVKELPY